MDFANFTLWAKADARPPPQYGLLLKLIIYNDLRRSRRGPRPLYSFTPERLEETTACLDYQYEFLLDTYWNDLPMLDAMITKFTLQQPHYQRYPLWLQSESESLNTIKDFLYPFGRGEEDALGLDLAYLSKLERDSQKTLEITANKLSQFTRDLRLQNNDDPYKYRILPPPYANSIRRWLSCRSDLEDLFDKSLQQTTKYIKSFLERSDHQLKSHDLDTINETDLAAEVDKIHAKSPRTQNIVLFAVSGSGKTRSIEHLLSCRFGFYFQACYVPLQAQGLHSAQRTSGSEDTLTLGKMIKYAQEAVQQADDVDEASWVTEWLENLMILRRIILGIFVDEAEQLAVMPELLPRLWYKLQVSDKYDIFDETYQILCLLEGSFGGQSSYVSEKIDESRTRLRDKQLYYCVDEAQDDIDTQICTEYGRVSLLSVWSQAMFYSSRYIAGTPQKLDRLIYSGTSLRTTEAVNAIGDRRTLDRGLLMWKSHPKECIIFSSFPTVRDDEQFKTLLSKHGWQDVAQSQEKNMKVLLQLIVQHARPLYGRPGWSVRYLKKLENMRPLDSTEDSKEAAVLKASEETVNEVKGTLKARLHNLQLKGEDRLIEDLCRVVVWSDLTDRPTFFWDDTGVKMIEQAFAVVSKARDGKSSNGKPLAKDLSQKSGSDQRSTAGKSPGKMPTEEGSFLSSGNDDEITVDAENIKSPGEILSNRKTSDATSLYTLEERLALDAAKEYILTSQSDLVERYLGQYLQEHANTTGSFGKPAEYFLAWSLDRAFINDAKRLSGSSDLNRSTSLLEALSSNRILWNARKPPGETVRANRFKIPLVPTLLFLLPLMPVIFPRSFFLTTFVTIYRGCNFSHEVRENIKKRIDMQEEAEVKYQKEEEKKVPDFYTNGDQPSTLDLSGYTLVRGHKTGHAFDDTVSLVDWMSGVRGSIKEPAIRPNTTFYFPDEQVGPDIMFALHKKSPEGQDEVVLCVLQLKCGEAELEKGIIRTDLSKAYKSKKGIPNDRYQDQSQALENELKAWSAAREYKILRVLVTAAVRPTRAEKEPVIVRGTSCVEYFIRCDARQTELLFGRSFKVLLDSLRSEGESLSAIYAKANRLPSKEDTPKATTRVPLEERRKKTDVLANSEEGSESEDGGILDLLDLN